jgi:mannosyltransferase OCH1-like enzyme
MFEYERLNKLDVLVYCGGKCGSSTLHTTFKKNCLTSYKIHDNSYFQYVCNIFKKDTTKTIYDVIDFNAKQGKNFYIIDSYRTPIERKISSFFQNIENHIIDFHKKTTEEIISIFNAKLLYELEEYQSIDEAQHHYGMSIFNQFDFEKKYNIVNKDNIIFIKLRLNDIDEWSDILSEIFEKKIVIHNNNLTSDKQINKLYNQFKEMYKVPQRYIYDYLINDKAFKIYNTKKEQDDYINRWLKKSYSPIFPKNIWFYWDDLKNIPTEVVDNVNLYNKNYPDFKVEIIIDDNINTIPEINNIFPGLLSLYNKLNIYAAKSDVARLLYLYFYGGIYLDTHIEHIFKLNSNNIYTLYEKYKNYDCIIPRTNKGIFNCTTLISKPYCKLLYDALCEITKKLEKHYKLEKNTDEHIKYNILDLTGSSIFFFILKFYELKHIIRVDEITNSVNFKKYNNACFCCSDYFNYNKVNFNYNHGDSKDKHWSEKQKIQKLFIEK